MMQSPAHKHLFMADLEWLVLPPVLLRKFRIFRCRGVPIGFASWAYLSEEAEARFKAGARRLKPEDWKSGDRLWLIDVIAPFGGGDAILKELRERAFKGQTVKALQPAPGGDAAVVEW
jgi:cytolysin-activating lysine-acyltransferase